MNRVTTHEALTMLAQVFEEPLERLSPATPRAQVAGWDSMGALSLMAELDERFGIELTADVSRSITHIGGILDLLRAKGALSD